MNGFFSHMHSRFIMADHWFYQSSAGIRPDPTAAGFKKIIIQPAVVGDLSWVKSHHDSPYSRIVSNWKREGDKLTKEVTIPPNTTATIYIPATDVNTVTEVGQPVAQARGVVFMKMETGAAVYAVGAGTYQFSYTLR